MLTFMADGSFCSWSLMETTLWHIAMPGAGAIHTISFNKVECPLYFPPLIPLIRSVAVDGGAVHPPALAVIIIQREMLGAAVVPKRD